MPSNIYTTVTKSSECLCPMCHDKENQITNDQGIEDAFYYYDMECQKCGCQYRDCYLMTYYDTEIISISNKS